MFPGTRKRDISKRLMRGIKHLPILKVEDPKLWDKLHYFLNDCRLPNENISLVPTDEQEQETEV